jgi:DNA-binding response OmpR family regulator
MLTQLEPAAVNAGTTVQNAPRDRRRRSDGPRVILLYTRDRSFDQLVADALLGSSALVLIARSIGDAIQIACRRGRELDLAVLDFDDGCRGMTLLSAVHTCYEQLPVLIITSGDEEHVHAVAAANGARACLEKPIPPERLGRAIATLSSTRAELIAA